MNAASSSTVSSSSVFASASSKAVCIAVISSWSVSSTDMNSSNETPPLPSVSARHRAISGARVSSFMPSIETSNIWRPSTESAGVKEPEHSTNDRNSSIAIGSISSLLSCVSSAIAAITSVCVVVVVIEYD